MFNIEKIEIITIIPIVCIKIMIKTVIKLTFIIYIIYLLSSIIEDNKKYCTCNEIKYYNYGSQQQPTPAPKS